MPKLKLIYFKDCPNAEKIRNLLSQTGHEFEEVRQDDLSADHFFRAYSSPAILKNNELIFGTKTGFKGGCTLEVITVNQLQERIEA